VIIRWSFIRRHRLPEHVSTIGEINVEISIKLWPLDYDLLLSRLPEDSPLHVVLKNGVVIRDSCGHRMVQILCKSEHAKMLSYLAQKICPDAVSMIEKGIKFARTPS